VRRLFRQRRTIDPNPSPFDRNQHGDERQFQFAIERVESLAPEQVL
jgi:hypothetical protein